MPCRARCAVAPAQPRAARCLQADRITDRQRTTRAESLNAGEICNRAKGFLLGLVTLDDALEILAEQLRTVVGAIESERRRERKLRG